VERLAWARGDLGFRLQCVSPKLMLLEDGKLLCMYSISLDIEKIKDESTVKFNFPKCQKINEFSFY
jgi:hypothetical protein